MLSCNYYRFLKYLHVGTIIPIRKDMRLHEKHVCEDFQIQFAEDFPAEEILESQEEWITDALAENIEDWERISSEEWYYPD